MLLVTGGAGYIGSHTCHQLIEAGFKVVCLDNFYSGHRWAVPKKAIVENGNVGDSKRVGKLIKDYGIKTVFHLAGHIEVEVSVSNPLKYYGNNTVATHSLLSSCI